MSETQDNLEAIFDAALELPAEERPAYLSQACAGNEALRRQVERLLRNLSRAGHFLTQGEQVAPEPPVLEKPGNKIGRYKLLQQIGEGGCGVVYMAEQEEPLRRRVALKIIKLGMDTRSVIARFEVERQALAMMDHPNIAKVFDAGATESPLTRPPGTRSPTGGEGRGEGESAESQIANRKSQIPGGRPYFVMELVRGTKITDYCDEKNLSTQQRLNLFMKVCQAIQHAHQKGIIHRDIKPSNVLVTVNDRVAVPKVIDFGIAKATTDQRLTDKTVFTAFEQFIGTPAYMSPEQAEITSVDVDTRSDIYSLGVLLYELLTGKTPFDPKELLQAGLDEMRRTIRETEPPKPSTRLTQELAARNQPYGGPPSGGQGMVESTRAATSDAPPAKAGTPNSRRRSPQENQQLIQQLRGDLDWIVMKALEKDRARRYETANGLASDIQRHLSDEPVIARPPSNFYRFQKFIRRNKVAFTASSAIAAALMIGLGVALWQSIERNRAYTRALAAEKAARKEAAASQQVARFLQEMLQGVGPSKAPGRDTSMLKEILDKTAERIGKELTNQPEVEMKLLATLGDTYIELGLHNELETVARRELEISRSQFKGQESLSAATGLSHLGATFFYRGNFEQARSLCSEALAIRKKLAGTESAEVADSLSDLTAVLLGQGKLAEAEAAGTEAVRLIKKLLGESRQLSESLFNLGTVLRKRNKLAEAASMFQDALAIDRKLFGDLHPYVARELLGLGAVLQHQGKLVEAETISREALAMKRKLYGENHGEVAVSLHNLAVILDARGQWAEAEAIERQALEMRRKLFGSESLEVATSLDSLSQELLHQSRLSEAETMNREALAVRRKVLGAEHPDVASTLSSLALVLQREGKLAEAEAMQREALAMRKKLLGEECVEVAKSLHSLADVIGDQGKLAEEEAMERKAIAMARKYLGDDDLNVAGFIYNLGRVIAAEGRLAEAETVYREALAIRRRVLGNEHPDVANCLYLLASVLCRQEKPAEAEHLLRECLAIREKMLPDQWITFEARSVLGGTLMQQKKYTEAEPLLLSGYDGMKQREGSMQWEGKFYLRDALQRVVKLYEATERPAQAAEWKQKLAELDAAGDGNHQGETTSSHKQ